MNNGNDKPRLTEEQKKLNHIESEKKRREAIREGFDQLADLVPGMTGQGRSESVVLQATVEYLKSMANRKEELRQIALYKGMTNEAFDRAYETATMLDSQNRSSPSAALQAGGVNAKQHPSNIKNEE